MSAIVGSESCKPCFAAGRPTFSKPGAKRRLPGDERRASRRAGLLSVVIGEQRALACESVDVRRAAAHHAAVVGTDVPDADVVGHDHDDVRFACGSHRTLRLIAANGPLKQTLQDFTTGRCHSMRTGARPPPRRIRLVTMGPRTGGPEPFPDIRRHDSATEKPPLTCTSSSGCSARGDTAGSTGALLAAGERSPFRLELSCRDAEPLPMPTRERAQRRKAEQRGHFGQ